MEKVEYVVKKKMVEGEYKYGIIDQALNVRLPFVYEEIIEKELPELFFSKSKQYYVCKADDGNQHVFWEGEIIFVIPDVIDVDFLAQPSENGDCFSVKKEIDGQEQWGIVEGKTGWGYSIVYPFGKAEQIKRTGSGIDLFRNENGVKLQGKFRDDIMGTLDPEYTFLGAMSYGARYYEAPAPGFDDKIGLGQFSIYPIPIQLVKYSKNIDGENLTGAYVRVQDDYGKNELEELIPCQYRDFTIMENQPFVEIRKKSGNKVCYGLAALLGDYYEDTDSTVKVLKFSELIPCQYDKKNVLKGEDQFEAKEANYYAITTEDGKKGLSRITVKNAGLSFHRASLIRLKPVRIETEKMLDNLYQKITPLTDDKPDSPKAYVFEEEDNQKGLIVDLKRERGSFFKTTCNKEDVLNFDDSKCFIVKANVYLTSDRVLKEFFVSIDQMMKTDYYGPSLNGQHPDKAYEEIKPIIGNDCSKLYKATGASTLPDLFDILGNGVEFCDIKEVNKLSSFRYVLDKKIDYDEKEIIVIDESGNVLVKRKKVVSWQYDKLLEIMIFENQEKEKMIVPLNKRVREVLEMVELNSNDLYEHFEVISGDINRWQPNFNGKNFFVKYKKKSSPQRKEDFGLVEVRNGHLYNDAARSFLDPTYKSIDFVFDGKRIILSTLTKEGIKYGVCESIKGNTCIPLLYDNVYVDENDLFVARKILDNSDKEKIDVVDDYFDQDGCLVESKNVSLLNKAKTLVKKKK